MDEVTQVNDPGDAAYVAAVEAAAAEPGPLVLRVTCARCGDRAAVAKVHRRGSTLLWVADGHAPEAGALVDGLKAPNGRRVPGSTIQVRVLLNVPPDERAWGRSRPDAFCRRHGRLQVDEARVLEVIASAPRSARPQMLEV